MEHVFNGCKKIIIAIVGLAVLVLGIILLFYPGPGWLVIFAGLAILSTEFKPVQGLLDKGHNLYDKWQNWIVAQNWPIKLSFICATCVGATLMTWLMNGFGMINGLVGLNADWLISPFFG